MTAVADRAAASGSAPPQPPRQPWLVPLLRRLHWLTGVLVGPCILVAALSGAAYALAPAVEQQLYREALTAPATGEPLPLAEQVRIAQGVVGDEAALAAVRPAPEEGATTRVLFAADGLQESESRAVFVDPVSGDVRGDMTVYGTSGSLPLRTAIDHFHRGLGLGDVGRLYSELAASWLGIVVLAGVGLWIGRWASARRGRRRELLRPERRATGVRRLLSWHASLGIWLALGALFLSATGITWSQLAGANVTELRGALGWTTPSVSTALDDAPASADDPHAGHGGHGAPAAAGEVDPALFDAVLAAGRERSIDVGLVEIRPPAEEGTAWVVQEIQRSFPTQVDAVAVDGATLAVVDEVRFDDYGLIAKLARWGIDLHMGTMFGLVNQLVLAALAIGIAAIVALGMRMWWRRGPYRRPGAAPGAGALAAAPWWGLLAVVAVGAALGLLLPLVGWTLVAFVLLDGLLVAARTRPTAPPPPS
ncbi:PepSY-associated TM helix domain-containing protein [Agrococcus terreus]|uniref:Membrane protein n=1 Tax=Agrococcus terreus TaxID=574649 RepID=A0ABQ2KF25_9MICO|nr:PepSY-associated TM helix domain-containing protein [Agrococcus terreus]GGN80602.1 membrane protein [Agrococcus terreus]